MTWDWKAFANGFFGIVILGLALVCFCVAVAVIIIVGKNVGGDTGALVAGLGAAILFVAFVVGIMEATER